MPLYSRLIYSQLRHSKLIYSMGNTMVTVTDTGHNHLLLETGDALLLETGDKLLLEG